MADIRIVQQHRLSNEKARAAAVEVADKLASKFGLACKWDGDILLFQGSGVSGSLTLADQRAELGMKLGFFASAFAAAIEAKVVENMRAVFGGA